MHCHSPPKFRYYRSSPTSSGTENVWCATGMAVCCDTTKYLIHGRTSQNHRVCRDTHATLIELNEPYGVWVAFLGGVAGAL